MFLPLRPLLCALLVVLSVGGLRPAAAQAGDAPSATPARTQPALAVPDAARPGPGFTVERATRAWLDTVPADVRARSDAYYEGGYWLQLVGWLYGLGVAALLLFGGWSARLRDWSERRTRRPWLQGLLYGAGIIVLTTLLTAPLTIYQDWWREHAFRLSNLSFVDFMDEQGKGLLITVLLGAPLLAIIFAVVRRTAGRWWLPATAVTVVFLAFLIFVTPVFIMPVFNHYQPLPSGPVRDAVLSMARANGVPADDVYWFDASKQTSRISANVSGMGHTMRISLNDNLLNGTSLPEIKAVMAHEMGHYVLNHSPSLLVSMSLMLAAGFACTQWAQRRLVARYGARWRLRGPQDMAGLPAVIALLSTWFFLMTPVTNTIVRAHESEADAFGLNAAREPQGFAAASMRLATYRKLEPTPLEEFVFYNHPSGHTRVLSAMRWAAENPTAGEGAAP